MNVTTLRRNLLASVIGSALAFAVSASSIAHAQVAAGTDKSKEQTQEEIDKAEVRRARQAAHAAERDAQAKQEAAQPQPPANARQSGTVDAWQVDGNAAAAQEQARQQQQAQRDAQQAQLREVQDRQRQMQEQQRAQQDQQRQQQDQQQQLQAARERETQREQADQARTAEQQRRMGNQQREQDAAQLQAQQAARLAQDARQRDAQITDQRERQRDLRDGGTVPAPRQDDGRFAGQRDAGRYGTQGDVSGRHLTQDEVEAARNDERRREYGDRAAAISRSQQAALIEQQRRQVQQYSQSYATREALARQQSQYLQQQNRNSQYAYQQRYYDLLRQQGQRNDWQNYNYYGDPYFSTQPSYRYYRSGNYYQVSDYAARLLRQAVQYGYREGIRAGRADEQDGWRFDFRSSFAYRDANYGYRGFYVRQSEYNYYFRQGFRRGYEDGFYGRRQYGRYNNGSDNILTSVLSLVLNLQPYSGGYNQSYYNNGY